jgi:DeoD family purine-nucleoside phosphorylase
MPIHLRVEEGAYAPNVLCPGDPRRATYIAETFFDPGAELVNEERGMLGYTGTFNGHPISVQSTGMGSPSIAIVVEELIMLGAQRLIRVGTCGAIRPGMHMADTVIGMSATADDDNALRYANVPGFAPTATYDLVESAVRLSRESGANVHVGPIVTGGLFYQPDETLLQRWRRVGILAIEMEASMLYAIAAVHGVEALAIMTVSDLVGVREEDRERISDEDLKRGVDAMMRIACRVAVS